VCSILTMPALRCPSHWSGVKLLELAAWVVTGWTILSRDMSRLERAKSPVFSDRVTMSRLQPPRDGSLPTYHSETQRFTTASPRIAPRPSALPPYVVLT
jgi:hypothetical protein